jgi:hypothetical protein
VRERRRDWREVEEGVMSFSIEIITPREDAKGAIVHTVVVTIDDHETVLTFESQEEAEAFAQTERARLAKDEKNADRTSH